jgi:tetratricopeptide (TPR) repeat protein
MVAIGLARLRSGDQDAARKEFNEVLRVSEKLAAELRESGAKDAFSRKEAQAYLRASHALGCLAFDQERYQDALVDLERVYAVDQGAVGTEARLIAGAALLKLKRPADAVPILEVASKSEAGAGRALLSLGLANFAAGDRAAAQAAMLQAFAANSHFGAGAAGPGPLVSGQPWRSHGRQPRGGRGLCADLRRCVGQGGQEFLQGGSGGPICGRQQGRWRRRVPAAE